MTTHKQYLGPSAPASAQHETFWHSVFGLPRTSTGWTAVVVALAGIVLYALFWALVASGQRGGEALFSNPLLGTTLVLADTASLIAGATALRAMASEGERSLPVMLTVALAIATLVFLAGAIFA